MVSVVSDDSYDEVFTEDDIFEQFGKSHPLLTDAHKITGCAGIEEKGKKDE